MRCRIEFQQPVRPRNTSRHRMRAFEAGPLRTERLVLRPLTGKDVPSLFSIHSDPRSMRYWSAPIWKDEERGRAMVERDLDPGVTGHVRLGIEQRSSGQLVGTCAFFEINDQCRRAELGYMLASPAWGQGYMQEALTAFIGFGFSVLNLNRIEADTDPRNRRSMQLLHRLHFIKEGHFRDRWVVEGEVSDAAMFGLLRRDWPWGCRCTTQRGLTPRSRRPPTA